MARIPLAAAPHRLEPTDPGWPGGLSDLPQPPAALQIAGTLPHLTDAVAIVGTRYADEDAMEFTGQLARQLAAAGRVVISGGAHGIDAAAHAGALAAGAPTIAVLATGLERAYPARHAPLFAKIARSGALICEVTCKEDRGAWIFLRRNRLVAAMASAVVVVQAPARSGALSTADWAKRLKRRLFAVPGRPQDPRSTGCLELLRGGAEICTSAADILSLAPSAKAKRSRQALDLERNCSDDARLSAEARAVWECLRGRTWHPDQISLALDMPANEVQEALLSLMLSGLCRRRDDGSYATTVTKRRDET
jgi:DNA processing protein